MITIISATNRPNSNTFKLASFYSQLLEKQQVKWQILSLESVPENLAFGETFGKRSEKFQQLLEHYIIPIQKFIIVAPEYNGSYPGILKTFFDAIPPDYNRNKKVGLIGVSSGRAGNLRGMEHLTGVLNYLGMHVHPNKQPVSVINTLFNEKNDITDPNTLQALNKHITDLINF